MEKVATILRQSGYKLTPQRRAVVSEIAMCHEHLTPAALYERVHRKHKKIGLVTVYRTLEVLTELGLICQVHGEGVQRSYLLRRPSGHHHHLVCSGCGKVVDFAQCNITRLEQKLSRETGFAIDSHLLEFLGRCRECRRAV
jgi:Fur family ferric uptake transcriptional regulator